MARGDRVKLTERLEIIHRNAIACQMEHRVEKRRVVAARKDETVAVDPFRMLRIATRWFLKRT
jgi:hypothetical protein